jgi:hypothetical protein
MAMSPDEQSVYKSSVENPSFMTRQQWVIAGYAVADTPRILSASSCALGTNKLALRPSIDGPPIRGLIGIKCAQVGSTRLADVQDAAHEAATFGKPQTPCSSPRGREKPAGPSNRSKSA